MLHPQVNTLNLPVHSIAQLGGMLDLAGATRGCRLDLLPAIRSLERRARYLFYCFFLFGHRFLSNPRADSHQSSHAGVLWFRMCLLPFWGLAAPGGRKKGQMKFSLLWESMGNFLHFGGF